MRQNRSRCHAGRFFGGRGVGNSGGPARRRAEAAAEYARPGERADGCGDKRRQAQQAVGHAVTATYLYCGAADAYMETSDESLLAALERLWSDVARRKMYIHGGVGPLTITYHPEHDTEAKGMENAREA